MVTARVLIFLSLITALQGYGFTLLSGNSRATLRTPAGGGPVVLLWNGAYPTVKKKEKFAGGAYAHLGDKEFMGVLLSSAVGAWNSVRGSSLALKVETDPTVGADPEDLIHAVVVEDPDNAAFAAFALPMISEDGSTIEDCDITVAKRTVEARDLAYTILHELGHCIGLGHSHTDYNAVMGYSRSSRNFSLGTDDKAGLIYLYPDPAFTKKQQDLYFCGQVTGQGPHPASGWAFLLPVLFLLVGKPRRV